MHAQRNRISRVLSNKKTDTDLDSPGFNPELVDWALKNNYLPTAGLLKPATAWLKPEPLACATGPGHDRSVCTTELKKVALETQTSRVQRGDGVAQLVERKIRIQRSTYFLFLSWLVC